jgi:hypothetical protein
MNIKTFMSKKVVAIGLAAGITLGLGGAAFAYWTTGGAGTGSAATGAPQAVVVNQTSSVTGMYPGDIVALSGNFDNLTNPGSVYITSVTAAIGTLPTGCVAADFSISGTSNTPGEIVHGTAVGSWSGLSITMNDTGVSQNSCATKNIPIVYTAS